MTNAEDFNLSLVLTDEDDVAIDISDFTFEFTMTDESGATMGNLDWTSAITTDLPTSTVTIYKAVANGISDLAPSRYKIGLRYVNAVDSTTTQLLVGTVTVENGWFES
jgi:hypothetical protein